MIIPRSTTFIRKVSTSTKKTVSSAASCWTLPRQLYIFMWSTLIHKLNYQRWEVRRWTETSICGNIWLPTVSWYQPLPIWSEHQTQINWAALWSHILEWCNCGYGSKIERVRMHSSGIGSWLNHWPSLVHIWQNKTTRLRDKLLDRDVHRDPSSTGYCWGGSCMSTIPLDHTYHTLCLRLAPARTRIRAPGMPKSVPNNTWCRCFADGMWYCVWSTVLLRLLTDASMSGNECSFDKCIVG